MPPHKVSRMVAEPGCSTCRGNDEERRQDVTNHEVASIYESLSNDWQNRNDVKDYVWNAFIMNEDAELIPEWLSLSTVDAESEDLRLKFPHETLLQNMVQRVIKKSLAKKCFGMFAEIAK